MKKSPCLFLIVILCCNNLCAQNYKWEPVLPGIDCIDSSTSSCYVTDILFDSIYNQLYVCGSFDSMAHIFGTARFDGNNWKDMWGIPMKGQLMTRYKDKVIVYAKTGNFREIYAFDSTGVNDIGLPNGGIGAMEVYNGELYVGGDFSKIGNQKFNNIARWDGSSWYDVEGGVTGLPSFVSALQVFNNKLYVGGGFDTSGSVATWNIAIWNGGGWENTNGNGTYWTVTNDNLNAIVRCFGIYNNKIYMAGDFDYVNGIKTNALAYSSDGENWQGANYPSGKINCMKVWDNKLFTGQAGTPYIYQFDGAIYSVPDSGVNNSVFCLEVFNDELYCGGNFWLAGKKHAFKIAKLIKDTATGVTEIKSKEGLFNIFPNPSDGSLTLLIQNNSNDNVNYTLRIYDFMGKVYNQRKGNLSSNSSVTVPAQLNLSQGIYIVSAQIGNKYYSSKLVIIP